MFTGSVSHHPDTAGPSHAHYPYGHKGDAWQTTQTLIHGPCHNGGTLTHDLPLRPLGAFCPIKEMKLAKNH